jgi:hypothetical protein
LAGRRFVGGGKKERKFKGVIGIMVGWMDVIG